MGIIIGCCGIGMPDMQQLGEQPDGAQSCEHGDGHLSVLCGAGLTWLPEGIGRGWITGDRAVAEPSSESSMSSASESESSSEESSEISDAWTSAFFPGDFSTFSTLEACG